jgi:hypothetical protein
MLRRRTLLGGIAGATAANIAAQRAEAGRSQELRIAMTASDLPTVTGIPNNRGEGFRFLGYPAYDGVVNWDYSHVNQTADATLVCSSPGRSIPAIRHAGFLHCGQGSHSTMARRLSWTTSSGICGVSGTTRHRNTTHLRRRSFVQR